MAKENIFIKIKMKFMMVYGLTVRKKAMGRIFINSEKCIKEIFKIIKRVVLEKLLIMMVLFLMVFL